MLLKERRFGFRQFPDHIAIDALAPDDFETLEGTKRAEIETRMNAYFRQRIPMFPDEIDRFHWGPRHWPKLFDKLSQEYISEAFPDDADLREVIKTFKDTCLHNIARIIYLKRRWQLLVPLLAAAYLALSHFYLEPRFSAFLPVGAFWALKGVILAFILGGYWLFLRIVEDSYNAALESTAKGFVNIVQKRMNDLFNTFTSFGKEIDQAENRPGDWAASAKWWTKVLLWLSKRMEYIEKSIQLELWRIRIWHWITNRRGVVMLYVFAILPALAVGAAAAGFASAGKPLAGTLLIDCAIWIGFSLILAMISNGVANTGPNFLSAAIDTDVWKLYGDLALHDVLGEQVARDKRRILEELNRHKPTPYPQNVPRVAAAQ
jgi:hypothetical protein